MLGFWKQMSKTLDPFHFLLLSVAGWMNQKQQYAIEYLREENRVLRAQLGGRRLRFTDHQRRTMAVKARLLGRKMLAEMATIVTPQTLLGWHRKRIGTNMTVARAAAPAGRRQGKGSKSWSCVWRRTIVAGVCTNSGRAVESRP